MKSNEKNLFISKLAKLFDSEWYLNNNPDVALSNLNPLKHYLKHGASEGRNPNPLFDAKWYLKRNKDVSISGMDPLLHYIEHGASEGRNPNPLFFTSWYLEQYPDVVESGMNPLVHYIKHGDKGNYDPNPFFDTTWYFEHYPDAAESGLNPLVHFISYGATHGYDPSPIFDTSWYREQYPDVAKAGINPLGHYLSSGIAAGRYPNKYIEAFKWIQGNSRIRKNRITRNIPSYPVLPEGASYILQPNNERLIELHERYSKLDSPVAEVSVWSREYVRNDINLQNFRDDCAFVWQFRDGNEKLHYILSATYVKNVDTLGLFDLLKEDEYFGVNTFVFNDQYCLSRDLMDSILEINFLERHLKISKIPDINVLDIGAGYGRLAHRMAIGLPAISNIFCTDAIPESTFISEYYLNFRGVDKKAKVIPLYEIEETLVHNNIYLATNIHSFSECTIGAIKWWLDLLKKHKVRYLMIEPNADNHNGTKLISTETDNSRIEIMPELESRGYKLIANEPTYLDSSIQENGVSPTHYYLYELTL